MSTHAALRARPNKSAPATSREILQLGREVVAVEARAVNELLGQLNSSFSQAVDLLYQLQGNLIVTGMGKAGLIGQKLAATFASTGTSAHFMHPAEAFHGDLGRVQPGDVVLALSQSGETSEVLQLLPSLSRRGVHLIAITASAQNTLGRAANVTIELGELREAGWLALAPSTSTTVMLAIGDALALVVSQLHGFQPEDFATFHPGGSLGLKLSHVEDHMRPASECRMARDEQSVREVLVASTKPGRRSGAIMLTDTEGILTGLFTDSDLARLIEKHRDEALERPIKQVMVTAPTTVAVGAKMNAAVEILVERKISELPVVDKQGRPVGMIDVTDVVGLLPDSSASEDPVDEPPIVRIYSTDE